MEEEKKQMSRNQIDRILHSSQETPQSENKRLKNFLSQSVAELDSLSLLN